MTSILGKGTQWMEVVVQEVLKESKPPTVSSHEASILHRVESSNITELQSFTEKGLPMGHLHYTPVLLCVPSTLDNDALEEHVDVGNGKSSRKRNNTEAKTLRLLLTLLYITYIFLL